MTSLSIVLPAKNESVGLQKTLPLLAELYPEADIIVVDDGSDDDTAEVARSVGNVRCLSHPVCIGNGGAIKTGARAATGDVIVFMDADGQHDPQEIKKLLEKIESGYDMAVGARDRDSQASWIRAVGNRFYNRLASLMTGFEVLDLTSGFRAVKRSKFLNILYLLPNKFSYPTTSTMAFFRSGYFVGYVPVVVGKREGTSHIKLFRDGFRFMIIIMKIGALFSPMRLFLPISAFLFYVASVYYLYTYASDGRFTNMGMLLYLSSLTTFLIGVVSEQVSALHYKDTSRGAEIPPPGIEDRRQ
ncbi:MAG: glycosyltransferase family 2 protein [Granulosicoccus sp.]|nr:glycosyltransferase family 2 protein [Granulosicoccus sp.]